MQKDGIQNLQPTALAIKQAPSSIATVNTSGLPDEITITLRHIPQPEHLAKSCGRSSYTTYHAYFVNSGLNTKTFLGPVSKLRPGTFQLIAENIPRGAWDQLVISLAPNDPSDLGLPIFTLFNDFGDSSFFPERYTTLPAEFSSLDQHHTPHSSDAKKKQEPISKECCARSATESDKRLLDPGIPEANNPVTSEKAPVDSHYNADDGLLLQPGTVLPEDGIYTDTLNVASPSHKKLASMDGPTWFNLGASPKEHSEQTLVPIVINELPNHALWLVNYQGIQLVGYVFDPADPKKPIFIAHGVPGDYSRKAKPREQGYDYWVANPAGTGGYWLRYVNPSNNLISHPFSTREIPKNS